MIVVLNYRHRRYHHDMLILCDMESRSIPVNGYYYYIKYEWIYFTRNKNISSSIYSVRFIGKYRLSDVWLSMDYRIIFQISGKYTYVNALVLVFTIILTDLVSFLLDILKFSVDCMVFGTVSSDGNNTFGCNEIWQYGYG